MGHLLSAILCAAAAGGDSAMPALSEKGYAIVAPGVLPATLVPWQSGESWWGLFASETGYDLAPATLVVTPARGLFDRPEEQTGKLVAVEGGRAPLFLVKGLKNPVAGPMLTVMNGGISLLPGSAADFGIGGRLHLQFQAIGSIDAANANRRFGDIAGYELSVSGGKTLPAPQVLARAGALWSDGAPRLRWIGDLDRDGQLDFLINLSLHYAGGAAKLFLSTEAAPDELAGYVATMPADSC